MSNRGLVSAPKAKQKRARRLLANRVSAGNTSRKSAHAVYRAFFCARAIAAQWSEPRVGFRTESQTKKSPKALGKQGFCREYFAQIGACGLSCVFLRSCHCCAMERTAGWFPHRKPNKKEPEGSFLLGTPAGNRTRNGPLGVAAFVSKLRK